MTEFIRYLASEFSRKFTRNTSTNSVTSIISKSTENTQINSNKSNKSNSNKLNLGQAYNTQSAAIHVAHLHCSHDNDKNNINNGNNKKNKKLASNNVINEFNEDNYYFFDSENEEKKSYVSGDEHHYFDKNEIKNNIFEKRDIDTISIDSSLTNLTTITSTTMNTMNTFNRSPFFNHDIWSHRYNIQSSKIIREEKIQESPDSMAYYLDSPLIKSDNNQNKKINKQDFYKYADNFDKYLEENTGYLNTIKSQYSDSHHFDYQSDSQNSLSHVSN